MFSQDRSTNIFMWSLVAFIVLLTIATIYVFLTYENVGKNNSKPTQVINFVQATPEVLVPPTTEEMQEVEVPSLKNIFADEDESGTSAVNPTMELIAPVETSQVVEDPSNPVIIPTAIPTVSPSPTMIYCDGPVVLFGEDGHCAILREGYYNETALGPWAKPELLYSFKVEEGWIFQLYSSKGGCQNFWHREEEYVVSWTSDKIDWMRVSKLPIKLEEYSEGPLLTAACNYYQDSQQNWHRRVWPERIPDFLVTWNELVEADRKKFHVPGTPYYVLNHIQGFSNLEVKNLVPAIEGCNYILWPKKLVDRHDSWIWQKFSENPNSIWVTPFELGTTRFENEMFSILPVNPEYRGGTSGVPLDSDKAIGMHDTTYLLCSPR